MALPPALTTITVTGAYTDAAGTAQDGSVSFTPTSTVLDAAGKAVITETTVTALLTAGTFSLPLPCTDNAGLVPLGWAYTIAVEVPGAQQTLTPVYIPSALGSTVDVTQLVATPTAPAPSGVSYLPNAASIPFAAPAGGGGFLYVQSGALYWFGSSGTRTKIAAA